MPMDALLLPLRSNAAWFASSETRSVLESRVKAAVVIYDELIIQDGRYTSTVWERGSLDWLLPPDSLTSEQRRTLDYHEPGNRIQVTIRPADSEGPKHSILDGPAIESLSVDYYPILNEAGLLGEHYVHLEWFYPTEDGKKALEQAAALDRLDRPLIESLGVERFQEKTVVEALHFDSALASHLEVPFVTDRRVASFVSAKNDRVVNDIWHLGLRPAILDALMGIVLPNFAELDWDRVLRIRNSGAGADLRDHLRAAACEVAEVALQVEDARDLEIVIQKYYLGELAEQIRGESPTSGKTFLNLAANLLPFVGSAASTAADVAKLIEHRNSWIALIGSA
jgi:hypothetical protein